MMPGASIPSPNTLRIALAQRFRDTIKALSPMLTENELTNLHVLGFQSPQPKPMSPPPSRSGPLTNGHFTGSTFPTNPLLLSQRLPSYDSSPPSSAASDSDVWSPRSAVSSASSNDSTNESPRSNLGRCYLKTLGCNKLSQAREALAPCISNITKRCASPLSIIAACNDRKRVVPTQMSNSPMSMDDSRTTMPPTPRLRGDATPSSIDEESDWSSAGTIDPKLLQLNSSALTAVKGLCSLSQRATVFPHGEKRTFSKSYSMGYVQADNESAKRQRGAISNKTLARML